MTENESTLNAPNRRTVLQAIGGIAATGTVVGKTTATSGHQNDRIDYEELDSESKTLFQKLLAGEEVQRKGSELPTDLLLYDQIRYKQSVYQIRRDYSKEPTYHISFEQTSEEEVAERLKGLVGTQANSPTEYIESRGKVMESDLPATARTALLNEGRTEVKALPHTLIENQYLETGGTLYRVLAGHGDVPSVTFSASKKR